MPASALRLCEWQQQPELHTWYYAQAVHQMAPSVEPGAATRFLEVTGMVTPDVLQVGFWTLCCRCVWQPTGHQSSFCMLHVVF